MRSLVDAYLSGSLPPPPVCSALGMRMISGSDGRAEFQYTADGRHANPMGTLHGGILCDLADGAMGMALASSLAEGESFTTLELKMNFLRPVKEATLSAKARTIARGRTVAMMECDVLDEEGRLVARASATQLIVPGGPLRE